MEVDMAVVTVADMEADTVVDMAVVATQKSSK